MIKRCDMIKLEAIGWGDTEVPCQSDAEYKARDFYFCENCFLEAVRDGVLRGAGVVALFEDDLREAAE